MRRDSKKKETHESKKNDVLDYLKVRFLKVKQLCARDAKVQNLTATNLTVTNETVTNLTATNLTATNLTATNGTVNNLNSTNINLNGRDLSCLLAAPVIVNSINPYVFPPLDLCENIASVQDSKPPTVDQTVWEELLQNACLELNGPFGSTGPIPPCIDWAIAEASISGSNLTITSFYFGDSSNIVVNQSIVNGTGIVGPTGTFINGAFVTGGAGLNFTIDPPQNVASTRVCFLNSTRIADTQGLRARIQCGREFINYFLACKNCPRPCPACPEGATGTAIPICAVPMSLYAFKTYPIFREVPEPCGPTGATINRFLSSVNYNLNIDYQLEFANSTDARVVTILCQLCYIGFDGIPVIDIIDIGNKQFYPTLDVCYGEKYTGQINIPTDLIQTAFNAMPDPANTAAVQLVVYTEEGVQVHLGNACGLTAKQVIVPVASADETSVVMAPVQQPGVVLSRPNPRTGNPGETINITYYVNTTIVTDPVTLNSIVFGNTTITNFTEPTIVLMEPTQTAYQTSFVVPTDSAPGNVQIYVNTSAGTTNSVRFIVNTPIVRLSPIPPTVTVGDIVTIQYLINIAAFPQTAILNNIVFGNVTITDFTAPTVEHSTTDVRYTTTITVPAGNPPGPLNVYVNTSAGVSNIVTTTLM